MKITHQMGFVIKLGLSWHALEVSIGVTAERRVCVNRPKLGGESQLAAMALTS